MSERPRVAVSSCLLGERVRYDGAQKRDAWIADELALLVEFVAICPEVGAGMGVPRPAIRVVDAGAGLRLVIAGGGDDLSELFDAFAIREITRLRALSIDAYLFKARSPSCGLVDTPHFGNANFSAAETGKASGLWASRIRAEFPKIALADESDMHDIDRRNSFLEAAERHFRARIGDGSFTAPGPFDPVLAK